MFNDEDILTEHAEEAAVLWQLRQVYARRPQVGLADLAEHDERIEAHLDGLRLAGESGWRIAQRIAIEAPGPGAVFVLGAMACEDADLAVRRAVLAEVLGVDPSVADGLIAGLTWMPTPRTQALRDAWWRSDEVVQRLVALGVDVATGNDPGKALASACGDADVTVRARALRAVGELGRMDLAERCRRALDDQDPICRHAALWSLAVLGQEAATPLRALGRRPCDAAAEAVVDLAARRLPRAQVMEWLKTDAKQPALLRRAVHLAGAHGDTLVMPWLLLQLQVPAVARFAGEAFARITGVDLVEAGLATTAPAGFRSGPSDDPADEDVAMDPDEALPWPDADRVSQWWQQRADAFPPGVRHLLGKPLDRDHLDHVLRTTTQPHRAIAAIERALLEPGRPLFDVLAPAERQLRALAGTNVASGAS